MTLILSYLAYSTFSLLRFSNERIPSQTVISNFFDTNPASLSVNLTLTECDPPCEIKMYAFEEVRRSQIFPNETDFQAVCKGGSIQFADTAPVIQRSIVPQTEESFDGLLGKTVSLSSGDIILRRDTDIHLSRRGLWTVLIANCGPKEVTIDGTASIKRRDGFLDARLQFFSIVSVMQAVAGLASMSFFLFSWLKSQPKLSADHRKVILCLSLYAASGAISVLFFFNWNKHGSPPVTYGLISASVRAFSESFSYYVTLSQLQRPRDIPLWVLIAIAVPVAFGCLMEDKGISHFSCRNDGKWIFGFANNYPIEFIAIIVTHAAITHYSFSHKPTESAQNDRRRKFLGMFLGAFVGFTVMNATLYVWRRGQNLIETRKSEWVPFTLKPILFFFISIINGWYMGDINPEGWQTLESGGVGGPSRHAGKMDEQGDDDGGIPPLSDDNEGGPEPLKNE